MRSTLRATALATAALLVLAGTAAAQIGRESKHPETGPAGALFQGYRGFRPYPAYQPYVLYHPGPFYRGATYDRRPRYDPVYGY